MQWAAPFPDLSHLPGPPGFNQEGMSRAPYRGPGPGRRDPRAIVQATRRSGHIHRICPIAPPRARAATIPSWRAPRAWHTGGADLTLVDCELTSVARNGLLAVDVEGVTVVGGKYNDSGYNGMLVSFTDHRMSRITACARLSATFASIAWS